MSINRTSGFLFALALFFFATLLDNYDIRLWLKAILVWLLAFTNVILTQAIIAEVYGLNLLLFFVTLIAYLKQDERYSLLAIYLTGLSIMHHYSLIPFLLPMVVVLFKNRRNYYFLVSSVILFMLGISSYFILILHSLNNPSLNWGHISSLKGLIGTYFRLTSSQESISFLPKLYMLLSYLFSRMLSSVFSIVIAAILIASSINLIVKDIRERDYLKISLYLGFSLITILGMTYSLHHFSFDGSEVYLLPLISLGFISASISITGLKITEKPLNYTILLSILSLFTVIASVKSVYSNSLRNYSYPLEFGRDYLRSTVYKSQIVMTREGSRGLFVLPYISTVKVFRPDIRFKEPLGLFNIKANEERPSAFYFVQYNISNVFKSKDSTQPDIALVPMGLLLVAAPFSEFETLNNLEPWRYLRVPSLKEKHHSYDEYIRLRYLYFRGLAYLYAEDLPKALLDFSEMTKSNEAEDYLLNIGIALFRKKHFQRSIVYFEKARKLSPNDPMVLKILATNYALLKRFDKAKEAWDKANKIKPVE